MGPPSLIALDTVLRMGTVGVIWGSFCGSYEAKKLGLSGIPRAAFLVNALIGAAIVGAASGAGTHNWKQVAGVTGLVCDLYHAAHDPRSVLAALRGLWTTTSLSPAVG